MNSTRRGTKQRRLAGVAVLLLGLISMMVGFVGAAGTATANAPTAEKKVYVCKYVGTPGENERLQTGDNPINVSVNAIKDYAGPGSWFNDQHGRSYVIGEGKGDPEPSRADCPPPVGPKPVFSDSTGDVQDCSRKVVETIKTYYRADYTLIGDDWVLGEKQIIDTEVIDSRKATDVECPPNATTRTIKQTIQGEPNCTTGQVPVYRQEATVPVVDGVEGKPGPWMTVETTYRDMTQSELAKCPKEPKVFVCKYVGTPGVNERLSHIINPDASAVQQPVVIGSFFNDKQGRSIVIAWDTGQDPKPTIADCPDVTKPEPVPSDRTAPVVDCQANMVYTYKYFYEADYTWIDGDWVLGEPVLVNTVEISEREATDEECPIDWEPGSSTQTRSIDGAPDCVTKTFEVLNQARTGEEVSEDVWEWSEWETITTSTRNMTTSEAARLCPVKWEPEVDTDTRLVTQPTCVPEAVILSWTEQQTRVEVADGVWGPWSEWTQIGEQASVPMDDDQKAQYCPEVWTPDTETETRDAEAPFDCEVDPVPTWEETRTRTETAEGVWGAWSAWVVDETSRGSRPVTAAEAASCAEVLPSEEVKPTPNGPKDPQGPKDPKPVNAPTVLGVEAQAPAAVPTAVDAGVGPVSPAVASQGTNLWMLAGGMLVALGMALGFVPMPARGKHGR